MNKLFISFRIMLYLPHPQLKMPQWQWVRIWNLQQGDKLFVEVLPLTVGKNVEYFIVAASNIEPVKL